MSHEHAHPDREYRWLAALAILMPLLASILGVLATQAAPAGPGPGEESHPVGLTQPGKF